MDRFIQQFPAEADADLVLCRDHGVAYQADRNFAINYDQAYYNKCLSYEDQAIARAINAGRIAFVDRHFGDSLVLDVGIGSGEFIKLRPCTYGRDVNPVAIEWLKRNDLWGHYVSDFDALTFWDVIEHLDTPEDYFRQVGSGAYLFTSIPIFDDLQRIRESRHYRPGEHLYYWTEVGFVSWMRLHGFRLLERSTFEIDAGRDSIYSFAFCKEA